VDNFWRLQDMLFPRSRPVFPASEGPPAVPGGLYGPGCNGCKS
jgi:hypothetical protein